MHRVHTPVGQLFNQLTKEIILGLFMGFEDTFRLGQDIANHTVKFNICPSLWVDSDFVTGEVSSKAINEIKYLNDDGTDFSKDVKRISKNGGLYFFIIKSTTLPELANYLVYIGRMPTTGSDQATSWF